MARVRHCELWRILKRPQISWLKGGAMVAPRWKLQQGATVVQILQVDSPACRCLCERLQIVTSADSFNCPTIQRCMVEGQGQHAR